MPNQITRKEKRNGKVMKVTYVEDTDSIVELTTQQQCIDRFKEAGIADDVAQSLYATMVGDGLINV